MRRMKIAPETCVLSGRILGLPRNELCMPRRFASGKRVEGRGLLALDGQVNVGRLSRTIQHRRVRP